jgi:hypothetical protein
MKTYLNLCIAGIALIISWCGTTIPQTVEQPIVPSNPTPVQTQARSLTSSGYTTTGASRSPYSGSQFDVLKITDNSTQKRAYLIDCRGSWSACLDRRYNNMIPAILLRQDYCQILDSEHWQVKQYDDKLKYLSTGYYSCMNILVVLWSWTMMIRVGNVIWWQLKIFKYWFRILVCK